MGRRLRVFSSRLQTIYIRQTCGHRHSSRTELATPYGYARTLDSTLEDETPRYSVDSVLLLGLLPCRPVARGACALHRTHSHTTNMVIDLEH